MMRNLQRRLFSGVLLGLCLLASPPALRADPLTFYGTYSLIDSSPTRLDLFSNPGVILEARTFDGTLPLSFVFSTFVDFAGGQSLSDTIRYTYQEEGSAPVSQTSAFTTGTSPATFGFPVLFEPISRSGRPVPTTLTVELLNSSPDFRIPGGPNQGQLVDSYTYSFATVSPTPEPSTLLLLGTGIAFAVRRARRSTTTHA